MSGESSGSLVSETPSMYAILTAVLLNVLGAFEATYNKAKRRFNNMVSLA